MVAVLPLHQDQFKHHPDREATLAYIAANARIPATINFAFRGIFKSHTMKIGSVPKVQSANAVIPDATYVVQVIIFGSMHFGEPGDTVQNWEIGLHWKSVRKK
jgi:hypothetical protein